VDGKSEEEGNVLKGMCGRGEESGEKVIDQREGTLRHLASWRKPPLSWRLLRKGKQRDLMRL
jgi:hypothetical protein